MQGRLEKVRTSYTRPNICFFRPHPAVQRSTVFRLAKNANTNAIRTALVEVDCGASRRIT